MSDIFSCLLKQNVVEVTDFTTSVVSLITYRQFEALISRRQRAKLSVATQLAGGLWRYYNLTERLASQDADPKNTPLLILNRYANWDYVTEMMCNDIAVTIEAVNSYVATAWFPASLQGYLTIEHGNKAEALTLATNNIYIQTAAVNGLFQRDLQGRKIGIVVVGTFECIPQKMGAYPIANCKPSAFGAFSLISSRDSEEDIVATLSIHKEFYRYVRN